MTTAARSFSPLCPTKADFSCFERSASALASLKGRSPADGHLLPSNRGSVWREEKRNQCRYFVWPDEAPDRWRLGRQASPRRILQHWSLGRTWRDHIHGDTP